MPDQDSHQRTPDSDTTTTTDRGLHWRNLEINPPTGSADRPLSRPGNDASCLELAVDNGGFRKSLREIVGDRAARWSDDSSAAQPSSGGAPDDTYESIGRVFEAQEEIARRIAQSLHDEASQMLAIVYLELAHIARNSPKPTAERIDRVITHLDSVSEQIRALSHELHPMVLERHGLLPALRQLARGVKKRSGLDVKVTGEATDLSLAVEVGVYRAVQEALSNVVRHAEAGKAEVRLWQTRGKLHCSVRDDGIGYQQAEKQSKERYGSGLGLVGIFERIDSLGGECHILSDGRKGMELKLGIPL